MSKEQDMLYDLIQSLKEDMKSFSQELKETNRELTETKLMISKYNGLREQIGERDDTISKLIDKVDDLESKISKMDNTSKGKQQAFEYIRKWIPWIIAIGSMLFANLRG